MKNVMIGICLLVLTDFFYSTQEAVTAEELQVAIANWPPWKIIDNGKFSGIDVEILRTIGERLDITFKFSECPWKRCVEMARSGDVDMITNFGKTPERETFVYYLGPPYRIGKVVFYKNKGKPFSVLRYEDLKKIKIGTIKGSEYFEPFNNDNQLDKEEVTMERQLFSMLFSERIDIMIGWEKSMDYMISLEGFKNKFEKLSYSVTELPSYMAMSKESKALKYRLKISDMIREMVQKNEIEKIIDEF